MKIGILTFHRAINYGAVLQCFALQEVLKEFGHEVWLIDYRQARVEKTDRCIFSTRERFNFLLTGHLRTFLNYNRSKTIRESIYKRFDNYLNNFFCLTNSCSKDAIPQNFDIYIIGSDQVWNTNICDGLDPVFWGDFQKDDSSKLIAYAASTSLENLGKIENDVLKRHLLSFSNISVRERKIANFLNARSLLSFEVKTVLDPSLLVNSSVWDSMIDSKVNDGDYVLYFGVRPCLSRSNVLEVKANKLARKIGANVKTINFETDSPEDFVSKFRFAKAVITSSFHGVAFSLIFNKNLYAIKYGDEQDARYCDLLNEIHAEHLLYGIDMDNEEFCDVDYKLINSSLSELRRSSFKFLKSL